jgi:Holliday junction resolvasome RuvABC endonuclease subunit
VGNIKILGLDLSLTSTGYCNNGEHGVISVAKKGPERLFDISEKIKNIVLEKQIDVVIVEGYSFSSRNSQAHSIGELGGVVRVMLYLQGVPYVEVPPTCRAKFATGKGNAGKAEVISSISAKTGIVFPNPGSDDRCDAWVLEEMGLIRAGLGKFEWPENNLSSMDKVDWEPLDGKVKK